MIRNATVSAYDVLDQVWVHAIVQTREPNGEGMDSTTETFSVQVRGSGQELTRKWLRDALMELCEAL